MLGSNPRRWIRNRKFSEIVKWYSFMTSTPPTRRLLVHECENHAERRPSPPRKSHDTGARVGCVDRSWIYFGTIAPRKIEFAPGLPPGRLTIRLALPGVDFQAEAHVDPTTRLRFAETARRMRAADNPDTLIDIRTVEEDPLQPADVVAPGQGTAVAGRAQPRMDAHRLANVRPIAAPSRRQNGFSAKGS